MLYLVDVVWLNCLRRCQLSCCLCADPDGLPALAEKQKKQLQGWVRPDDICDDPKMIKMVSSMAIKQVGVAEGGSFSLLPHPPLPPSPLPLPHPYPSLTYPTPPPPSPLPLTHSPHPSLTPPLLSIRL